MRGAVKNNGFAGTGGGGGCERRGGGGCEGAGCAFATAILSVGTSFGWEKEGACVRGAVEDERFADPRSCEERRGALEVDINDDLHS